MRTFISKRKQEHEAYLAKKTKGTQKVSENDDSSELVKEEAPDTTPSEDHKSNGECKVEEEISPEERCSTVDEDSGKITEECSTTDAPINPSEGKGQRELKPPRVLEVLHS